MSLAVMSHPRTRSRQPTPPRHAPGLWLDVVPRARLRELHLTVRPLPGEDFPAMADRLGAVLREHEATVVRQEVFGANRVAREALALLAERIGPLAWPVTWVEGADCTGGEIAGMHVTAVSGVAVEPVRVGGRITGTLFDDGLARHCLVGGVEPHDPRAGRPDQAKEVIENIERTLDTVGMSLTDVMRTWFFLDGILDWYGEFNQVRSAVFQARHVFDGLVPASTGVGVTNPSGAALVAGARAMRARSDAVRVREVVSPKQCPARNYGSAFSRAVEVTTPEYRQVLVSGTASIEPGGRSICGGDVEAQIDLTMQVVRAILISREMDWPEVTRVTAYLPEVKDAHHFRTWLRRNGCEQWPEVVTQAVICREELLFEVELDALAPIR